VTKRRRLLFAVLPALAFLLVLEGAAWIGDAATGYRKSLLRALDAIETHADPLKPQGRLPWVPETSVMVRTAPPANVEQSPWKMGGVELPDTISEFRYRPLLPQDVADTEGRTIFVVGGSAAFGHPYPREQVFPGLLQERLKSRGDVVVNAAQIGWPSAGAADVLDRIVDNFDPDVVIIMTGNNEWQFWAAPHQPWGGDADAATMRTLAGSRALAFLQYWRVRRTIDGMDDMRAARDDFAMHRELFGVDYALEHPLERHVEFDAEGWLATKERFLDVFEENLVQMVRRTKQSGARAILLTVPFNHRLSPAWKHPQPESFLPEHRDAVRAAVAEAAAAYERGDDDACIAAADRALALDRYPPILHALRGSALERLERWDDAEAAYAQSREHMVGNLGGRLSINGRIRKVAEAEGAELLDASQLFEERQRALGGHFNEDLIHDDCHPSLQGHRVLADALEERL